MDFSDKLKRTRKILAISQEELAHQLGVSFATVNRWEKGSYNPSRLAMKTFENFCKDNNIRVGDGHEK